MKLTLPNPQSFSDSRTSRRNDCGRGSVGLTDFKHDGSDGGRPYQIRNDAVDCELRHIGAQHDGLGRFLIIRVSYDDIVNVDAICIESVEPSILLPKS